MKYILLIMTMLLLKSAINSFKSLFKNTKEEHEKNKDELKRSLLKLQKETKIEEDTAQGILIIVALLAVVYATTYYIMSAIYTGSLIMCILSTYLIVRGIKGSKKLLEVINDENKECKPTGKLGTVLRLGYYGYFVYFLVTTWN